MVAKRSTAFILPYRERRRLHDRAYRAQQRDHLEVCGVMVTDNTKRIELIFLKNRTTHSYNYTIDIEDIREVRKTIKAKAQRILGTFHSHPVGETTPGPGDLEKGFFNGLEMIYDVCGREVKLWRIKKIEGLRSAIEVPLILEGRKS